MKCSDRFAVRHVRGSYSFDVSWEWFHIGDDRHLNEGMLGIVCLKLIAGFKRTCMFSGMKSDADCTNLTRLDDFLEVQVAWRASAWSCGPCGYDAGDWQVSWMPIGRRNLNGRSDLPVTQEGTLCEFEWFCSIVTDWKVLLEFFAGKDVAEVAFG